MPSAIPADPWALPAGLEWCEETCMPGGNPGMWAIRSIDRTTAICDLGDTYELVDLIRRRDKEDPYPKKTAAKTVLVACPDCHGTRVYVGLGFFPAEPCRTCAGTGKVAGLDPEAPFQVAPVPEDPWALPPEAVAAGLGWAKGWPSWEIVDANTVAIFEGYGPNKGVLSGPAGDLDPGLVVRLFDLIKRRNVAEPPP